MLGGFGIGMSPLDLKPWGPRRARVELPCDVCGRPGVADVGEDFMHRVVVCGDHQLARRCWVSWNRMPDGRFLVTKHHPSIGMPISSWTLSIDGNHETWETAESGPEMPHRRIELDFEHGDDFLSTSQTYGGERLISNARRIDSDESGAIVGEGAAEISERPPRPPVPGPSDVQMGRLPPSPDAQRLPGEHSEPRPPERITRGTPGSSEPGATGRLFRIGLILFLAAAAMGLFLFALARSSDPEHTPDSNGPGAQLPAPVPASPAPAPPAPPSPGPSSPALAARKVHISYEYSPDFLLGRIARAARIELAATGELLGDITAVDFSPETGILHTVERHYQEGRLSFTALVTRDRDSRSWTRQEIGDFVTKYEAHDPERVVNASRTYSLRDNRLLATSESLGWKDGVMTLKETHFGPDGSVVYSALRKKSAYSGRTLATSEESGTSAGEFHLFETFVGEWPMVDWEGRAAEETWTEPGTADVTSTSSPAAAGGAGRTAEAAASGEGQAHSYPALGFSIVFPTSWIVQDKADEVSGHWVEGRQNARMPSILAASRVMTPAEQDAADRAFLERVAVTLRVDEIAHDPMGLLDGVNNRIQGIRMMDSEDVDFEALHQVQLAAGVPAYVTTYSQTHRGRDGRVTGRVETVDYDFDHGARRYLISLDAPASEFDGSRHELDAIVASFAFLPER